MKILVTGGTGFTGSYVVPLLLEQGWDVVCFVRETSDIGSLPIDRIDLRYGDLDDVESIKLALEGIDTLVSIASLGFGHASNVVSAAKSSGVERAVFFSTTSIYTTLNPDSKNIRMEAERLVQESGIPYTIIRPTMIYGSSKDRNICKFVKFLNRFPVFPVFGSGEYNIQPVYVGDLAKAVVSILTVDLTINHSYNLSGGSELTLNQFIREISDSLGKRICLIHLPPKPFVLLLSLFENASIKLPIKSEQIQRFNEHKAFSHQKASEDFNYSPRPFSEGLRIELKEMGLIDD
jgi:uncharacterized protein YbjT (DUF2867 family)